MLISKNSNIHFTSRNKTIRFADDIARKVNVCFPRISATLTEGFHNAKKFKSLTEKLNADIDDMRAYKDELYDYSTSTISEMLAFTKSVKEYKLGNCGESAQLAAIVAKVNGIKNAHIVALYTKSGKDLDHMALYVDDKKPYIIDAWLGIADYVPNIIRRYKNEFKQHFGIKKNCKPVFKKQQDDSYTDSLDIEFSRKQKNKLLKIYPDMLIRKY